MARVSAQREALKHQRGEWVNMEEKIGLIADPIDPRD